MGSELGRAEGWSLASERSLIIHAVADAGHRQRPAPGRQLALLHVASACRLSFPPAWRPQDIQTSSLATRGCTGEFSAEEVKSALSFFTQTWYSCGMAAAAFSLHSGSRTQVWIHEEENEGLPCSRGMAELWKNM